jgi:hypothetical protein
LTCAAIEPRRVGRRHGQTYGGRMRYTARSAPGIQHNTSRAST